MADMPCYKPNKPLYEVCLNMDKPNIKRLDCNVCVTYYPGLKDEGAYAD